MSSVCSEFGLVQFGIICVSICFLLCSTKSSIEPSCYCRKVISDFILVPPGFFLRNARNSLVCVNIEVPLRPTKRKFYNSTCRSACKPPPHQDPHRCSCRYLGSCPRRRRRRRGRGSSSQTRPRRAKETWEDSLGDVVFLGGNGLFRMIF